mgnify:FL=1
MNSVNKTRKLVGTAMLSAVGAILMYIGIKLPFMPSFITLDMADLPALIGSFAYGPARGAVICVLKNLLHLLIQGSQTGGVGEISNALLGIFFVVPAGLIYNKIKSKKGAFIGALVGAIAMAVMSIFSNYYFVYPVYTNFMPMEAIIAAYSAINPKVTNLWQALIMFNMPFTFMKGMISLAISMLIYKPLSPILKGKR